jgi:hypothetical protein
MLTVCGFRIKMNFNLFPDISRFTPNISELGLSGFPGNINADYRLPISINDRNSDKCLNISFTKLCLVLPRKADNASLQNLPQSVIRLIREYRDHGYPMRSLCLKFYRLPLLACKTELDLLADEVKELEVKEYKYDFARL